MSATAANAGPDLEEVFSDEVGFQDVALQGVSLRVSQPWPVDQLPPTHASLLSIASKKELIAVAGSDGVHIASTQETRRKYIPRLENYDKIRPLEPAVTLSVPRVSHVVFSSDEKCLIIAAEQGGGLAVYDTNQLSSGAQPAFQINTNGTSVRDLLPNPNPSSDLAHLVGAVLTDGKFVLADLRNQSLVNNASGSHVLHENVSAASWSKLGKQIVLGLADSTAVQIDAQGVVKDRIPSPPQLQELLKAKDDFQNIQAMPITSISWLATYRFFIIYSPTYGQSDGMNQHESLYFIAERAAKGQPLDFHKFEADPSPPFGMISRTPAHHFIQRLHGWHKAEDLLIVASTASGDINMLGQFREGAKDYPAGKFVTCSIPSDGRQARLPLSNVADGDASPLGLAVDLSGKEVAPLPVPSEVDKFQHSGLPLPALYCLNTDGLMNIWWIVYNDAVRDQKFYPGIVHRSGRYATYRKFTTQLGAEEIDAGGQFDGRTGGDEGDETEPLDPTAQQDERLPTPPSSATSASSPFGQSHFSQSQAPRPAAQSGFGQSGSGQSGFGQVGLGQKASPWGTPSGESSAPAKPAFGQSSFGQPSAPGSGSAFGQLSAPAQTSGFGKPSTPGAAGGFGKPSMPGAVGFGKPSAPGSGSAFGRPSTIGGGSPFAQPSQPASGSGFGQLGQMGSNQSPFAAAAKSASESPFAAAAKNASESPFATAAKKPSESPFGQYAAQNKQQSASPFATAGSLANAGQSTSSPFLSPFVNKGQDKPGLSQETSNGSTVTLGSGSSNQTLGSSFAAVSRESTFGDQSKDASSKQGGGLSGLGQGGFKLGSGFKGDGSAKNDLPKPKGSLFGSGFGAALDLDDGGTAVKKEPGTTKEPSLEDIPPAEPEEAPLPPDPSTYKAPKMPDDLPPMPSIAGGKKADKDTPIAGSPPLDVTNSQTFSPEVSSGEDGPLEDDDDLEDDEEDEENDEEGEEDEDDEEGWEEDEDDEDEDESDEEEEEETEEQKAQAKIDFAAMMKKVTLPPNAPIPKAPGESSPKSPEVRPNPDTESRTPQSDEKTEKSSYTPAGLPKGPVFPPPASRAQHSPRSPSPQRAVTSPVRGRGIPEKSLPSQIKTSAVPPAQPVERPAASPKPREPTAGELEDEAIARVESLLAAPIEPSKQFPPFYTHTDYAGAVDNPGIGGQIERVFRDVNSMIHTVGLNARSLESFLQGQETLRKPGTRNADDLDEADAWCLGDLPELTQLLDHIEKQLQDGRLEDVSGKLDDISDEQSELLKIRAKTSDMKKQIQSHVDPVQQAMRDAAPLSAETSAQQSELRQSVQRVQKLLSEVEEKMSVLRADIASLSSRDGQTNGSPVPTLEAVMNTISKMTKMVQSKSADIDLLESRIKRLPNGIASLRLADNYEDDISSRLAGNRLLTDRSSPAATTPRRPRMAANGDALGMSGMFGSSRFQTPPSGRRSMRFTPEASGFGRSTGSLGASTRKKMTDVTSEEVEVYQTRVQRRAKVLGALKDKVERKGVKVVRVD